jgi:hypothetical protein
MSVRSGSAASSRTGPASLLWSPSSAAVAAQPEAYKDARQKELNIATMTEEQICEREVQLRANLKLLEQHNGRVDATLARRIARAHYNLWSLGLRKTAIADTRAAYEAALVFPANRENPNLFVDCALVYMSFGAFAGALDLMNRIVEEFPKFDGIARVLQIRSSLWVRLKRAADAVKLIRYVRFNRTHHLAGHGALRRCVGTSVA